MNQPLAYVHPGAKIAKNVVIEPFTTIHNNVVIGDGTWIGSNVTIMEGARIGKNCNIFPGAVISAVPQDLKFHLPTILLEPQLIIGILVIRHRLIIILLKNLKHLLKLIYHYLQFHL